jgi:hypothetical protein
MTDQLIAIAVKQEQDNYAKAGAIAEEVLSCIKTVIAFNGQKQEIKRYSMAPSSARPKLQIFNGIGQRPQNGHNEVAVQRHWNRCYSVHHIRYIWSVLLVSIK